MDEEPSRVSGEANKEMTRLWRTWRTVFEMLLDRVWIPIFSSADQNRLVELLEAHDTDLAMRKPGGSQVWTSLTNDSFEYNRATK